ncbi:MAG TPA: glycosyltransferase family 2 protein [Vicinamibacterales bacterium]|jgi:glycosyltransferase involved in cell wall biosynthesis|nr:glycosyltransferase family 2 protein [Vicinamibacterales bacterium]
MTRAVVVPVYGNEASLPDLLDQMSALHQRSPDVEAIFVVDGSPDNSYALLRTHLPMMPFRSTLVSLSRNFGAHAAIRAGMATADAESIAILAADLQQPVTSIDQFFTALDAGADIVIGQRASREDRWTSRLASNLFWSLYRRFVDRKVPSGGVDSFACTQQVRDVLMSLPEASVNLIGLLFWVGYRRATVSYPRHARQSGRSGWTVARRLRYAFDTAFAFSDLPITLMMTTGVVGIGAAITFGVVLLIARLTHSVEVAGYTALMLAVLFSFSTLLLGLGIIGGYVWRISENTKGRPSFLVSSVEQIAPRVGASVVEEHA